MRDFVIEMGLAIAESCRSGEDNGEGGGKKINQLGGGDNGVEQ